MLSYHMYDNPSRISYFGTKLDLNVTHFFSKVQKIYSLEANQIQIEFPQSSVKKDIIR